MPPQESHGVAMVFFEDKRFPLLVELFSQEDAHKDLSRCARQREAIGANLQKSHNSLAKLRPEGLVPIANQAHVILSVDPNSHTPKGKTHSQVDPLVGVKFFQKAYQDQADGNGVEHTEDDANVLVPCKEARKIRRHRKSHCQGKQLGASGKVATGEGAANARKGKENKQDHRAYRQANVPVPIINGKEMQVQRIIPKKVWQKPAKIEHQVIDHHQDHCNAAKQIQLHGTGGKLIFHR